MADCVLANTKASLEGQTIPVVEVQSDQIAAAAVTTAKIADAAATNAKLAEMAAHTFKGNATGSPANPTDLTATQLTAELDVMVGDTGSGGTKGLAPAPAAGDAAAGKFLKADGTYAVPAGSGNVNAAGTLTQYAVVLGDGSTDVAVVAGLGSAGDILTSNGAGVAPTFQTPSGGGGGLVLLETQTVSGAASMDFTSFISSTYDEYIIEIVNLTIATNGQIVNVLVGTGAGPSWDTTPNHYMYGGNGALSNSAGSAWYSAGTGEDSFSPMRLETMSNTSTKPCQMTIKLYCPQDTSIHKNFAFDLTYWTNNSGGQVCHRNGGGMYLQTTALTGVQLLGILTTISGTGRAYGVAK